MIAVKISDLFMIFHDAVGHLYFQVADGSHSPHLSFTFQNHLLLIVIPVLPEKQQLHSNIVTIKI